MQNAVGANPRARKTRMTGNRSRADQQRITDVHGIPGLSLLPTAIDAELASRVSSALRSQRWKRWTWTYTKFARQDFGYEYNLRSRIATPTDPIPDELKALFPALRAAGWTGEEPNQVIVTRYPRGGSLGPHIDSDTFGPIIAGISLEAEWPISFSIRRGQDHSIRLPVLSAYVMEEEARNRWFHRIPPNYEAERERISLTFRTKARVEGGGGRGEPA